MTGCVQPETHQHHGVGRALLDAAITTARSAGHTQVVLTTATDTTVLRSYHHHRFRLTHIRPDAFNPEAGYPTEITIDGIARRDRAWLHLDL